MRTRLLNIVLLAALVLAVFRLWAFLREPPPSLPATPAGAMQPAAATNERVPAAEMEEARPETYDVIVARDLFSPTRGIVPPAPTAGARPAPAPLPPPKLTLYGVVILEGEKTAYLQEGTQESRPRKVRENENFANGVVKTIRPDGITFLFAGTEINVPLRTPKDTGAASSPGTGTAAPKVQAPVAFPRRQTPTAASQGQIPAPGRAVSVRPGSPAPAPPSETAVEEFGEEEPQDETLSGGDAPGMAEEEAGE